MMGREALFDGRTVVFEDRRVDLCEASAVRSALFVITAFGAASANPFEKP
jgi:hypothetical protein